MLTLEIDIIDINTFLQHAQLEKQVRITSISPTDGIGIEVDIGALAELKGQKYVPAIKGFLYVEKIQDSQISIRLDKLGAVNKWVPDALVRAGAKMLLDIPWIKRHTIGFDPVAGFIKIDSSSSVVILQNQLRKKLDIALPIGFQEIRCLENGIFIAAE
ncbi:MAG: hypothetical protein MST10_04580 [Lentisphaeria bacterium]|nr:hypothetical protein [Lentisphaeria bacterium]